MLPWQLLLLARKRALVWLLRCENGLTLTGQHNGGKPQVSNLEWRSRWGSGRCRSHSEGILFELGYQYAEAVSTQ